jgi:hypothetical protein
MCQIHAQFPRFKPLTRLFSQACAITSEKRRSHRPSEWTVGPEQEGYAGSSTSISRSIAVGVDRVPVKPNRFMRSGSKLVQRLARHKNRWKFRDVSTVAARLTFNRERVRALHFSGSSRVCPNCDRFDGHHWSARAASHVSSNSLITSRTFSGTTLRIACRHHHSL